MANTIRPNRVGLALALLMLCAIVPYWNIWHNGFIDFDDNQYVTENAIVKRGITTEGIAWAFRTIEVSNWHPLTWLSHMLDCDLFGLHPGRHHLTNLAFHTANTLLLFGVLFRMTRHVWRSGLVAALFAAHPLHVESVAWIAERKDVLSTFFGLLAIWWYIGYTKRLGVLQYSAVFVCFALSLLSKPMLVTLPFVLLLLDVWPLQRIADGQLRWRTAFIEKLPLLALSAASCMITIAAQSKGGAVFPLEALPFDERVGNAIVAYTAYIAKMLWPAKLAVMYPHPGAWPWVWIVGSALFLAAVSAAVIALRRERPWLLVGWLWYLGTLVPVIGLLQVGLQSMADRYTYVPLIGLFIMMAWSIPDLARVAPPFRAVVVAACVVVITAIGVRTQFYVHDWRTSETLFGKTLAITENNFIIHNNLGFALMKLKRRDEAIAQYRETLRINPRYAVAHDNLGNALLEQGDYDQAVSHYRRAIELHPESARTHNNLGTALSRQNRFEDAMQEFQTALKLKPDYPPALVNMGMTHNKLRQWDQAIAFLRRAIQMEPEMAQAHAGLGMALSAQRKMKEAIIAYQQALLLDSQLHETHSNLGLALASEKRLDEAIAHFRESLRLNPDSKSTQEYLKLALDQKAAGVDRK